MAARTAAGDPKGAPRGPFEVAWLEIVTFPPDVFAIFGLPPRR